MFRAYQAKERKRLRRGCIFGAGGILIGPVLLIAISYFFKDPETRVAFGVMSPFLGLAFGIVIGIASSFVGTRDRPDSLS
jgi:hypothetical protein